MEADLAEALRARTIRGAAMDVFSIEPLPADSELLGLDNIVVTPHLAAVTADTFEPTRAAHVRQHRRASRAASRCRSAIAWSARVVPVLN